MSFLYDSCAHSQGEKFYFLCTFLGGEIHWGNACTKGGKTFHIRKPCFVCFTLCVFLFSFIVLWVTFSIYALLLSLHHVCALDMHTSLCYCALLILCSDDHLLCYMIIVVISIWLLCVWSSCLYVSHHIYLIAFLLVTFILVILLLALPWGSNVFCASVSSYRYIYSKFITIFRFSCKWDLPLFLNVQKVCITPWTFIPPIYKLPIQAYYQTIYVQNINIS